MIRTFPRAGGHYTTHPITPTTYRVDPSRVAGRWVLTWQADHFDYALPQLRHQVRRLRNLGYRRYGSKRVGPAESKRLTSAMLRQIERAAR